MVNIFLCQGERRMVHDIFDGPMSPGENYLKFRVIAHWKNTLLGTEPSFYYHD